MGGVNCALFQLAWITRNETRVTRVGWLRCELKISRPTPGTTLERKLR